MDENINLKSMKSLLHSIPNKNEVINDNALKVNEKKDKNSLSEKIQKCNKTSPKCTFSCYNNGIKCGIEEVLKTSEKYIIEHNLIDKENGITSYEVHFIPIFNEEGKIIDVLEYCQDITARKKIENKLSEQNQFFNNVFHNIHEGIGIVDENENLTYCNPAFGLILEQPDMNFIGKNLNEVFDPNLFPFFMEQTEKRKSGQNSVYEILYRTNNGNNKYLRIYVAPRVDKEGNYKGAIGTMLDITERVGAEHQLIKAKEKAEESDRLKSVFLANMSHEIRTPMNGIIGFAELLDKPDLTIEKQKFYVNLIQTRSRDLLELINDIIDISKIEAGEINIIESESNLNEILDEILVFFKSKLNKLKKQHIEIIKADINANIETTILSDTVKLKQILLNLVENAIKFTEKGFIEIGYQIKGNEVLWQVKDTGIGIPKNKQKIIFERFRQVDEAINRSYGGAGLGLAICKAYVQLFKGNIWVESETGAGSNFYFTIPYKPLAGKITKTLNDLPLECDFIGKIILIVEDDPISSLYLQEILTGTGASLIICEDGEKALKEFRNHQDIDLVLLDIQLPEISGYQVAVEMKQIRENVPIIAQTAYASLEDKNKCLLVGCSDYIKKPIESQELLSKIFTLIGK